MESPWPALPVRGCVYGDEEAFGVSERREAKALTSHLVLRGRRWLLGSKNGSKSVFLIAGL